jgi:hypothetical protein
MGDAADRVRRDWFCRLSDVRCDGDDVEIDGGGGGDQQSVIASTWHARLS